MIPTLSNWAMHRGNDTQHGYTFTVSGNKQYCIDPISNDRGRFLGYQLSCFGLPASWRYILPVGGSAKNSLFQTAHLAVKAAREDFSRFGASYA